MKGCLKSVVFLLLLAAVAVVALLNRDRLTGLWQRVRGGSDNVAAAPSAEIANAADKKLAALGSGRAHRIVLTELELQSLLQFKYRGLLPAFVNSPRVELAGDQLRVHARIPVDRLPQLSELGEVAGLLPDTTELAVGGKLLPLGAGRVALTVDEVTAAHIPLPKRLVPGALRRLGREDEPGLPPNAFAVKLPPGADAAYVRGDSLVFLSNSR